MPSCASADTAWTGTSQPGVRGCSKPVAWRYSATVRLAALRRSPSALLTKIRSASSITPRLMPCNSSPPEGSSNSRKKSVISATRSSDWPTPTVSTITRSKPAASHKYRASRVRRATPPSLVPAGDGRMKAAGCVDNSGIRVLSPRMEPPLMTELGSTVSTATRWPAAMACSPNTSMKVDLPTPGTPVMPTLREPPVWDISALSSTSAWSRWSLRSDSTRVIARARAGRSPASTAPARVSTLCLFIASRVRIRPPAEPLPGYPRPVRAACRSRHHAASGSSSPSSWLL